MTEDDDDAVIVRLTIELGPNLGMKVVAEGVETEESDHSSPRWGATSPRGTT